MKEPSGGKSLASKVLTAKALDQAPQGWKKEPKVRVKRVDSLFLISYSDAASSKLPLSLPSLKEFNISLYIDIPTIDYYNDQLTHFRLTKFNKKFKIHKLKEQILASFTNFDDSAWDLIMQRASPDSPIKFKFSVASSGALRYVETIKFLVESCWHRIQEIPQSSISINTIFKLQVSPTSLIWFKTFLDKDLLAHAVVDFEVIGNYNMITSSTTPFKEYYSKLNNKFTSSSYLQDGTPSYTSLETSDSIVVVTNNTGVKALLTILSDKPLTSYLSKDSLEALHSNALQKKPSKQPEVDPTDSDEDDTPLNRDSSSLLSFQDSLITSNKDKSVKVRSTPYARSGARSRRLRTANTFQLGQDNHSTDEAASYSDLQQFEHDEDSDEEEPDEDEDENDDDGLSFSVPSRLSRCGSETDFSRMKSPESETTRRFRSLSLMDPALRSPFAQDAIQVQQPDARRPPTMEIIEDEMCSPTTNGLSQGCTNIYVHDGHFGQPAASTTPRKPRRLQRTGSANNVSVGLIPPEFFSRISSPSSSNSSSNTSLTNLSILPGTFSKLLHTSSGDSREDEDPFLSKRRTADISGRGLNTDASFRLASNQLSPHDMNQFALNFRSSKRIPATEKALDDEDRMMFGSAKVNESKASDEESKSNAESVSTLVGNGNDPSKSVSPVLKSLNIQFYGDDKTSNVASSSIKTPNSTTAKSSTYKKPKFTLDLYNDEEMHSTGGWLLGGNR
ncbi:LADA_0C01090g1_1 [Lachancea dasiensis]|uniref:LADA_0C01090g1_1 n=1 Tax=Lachancea dasiensis TaxID=1072105 RepID=A0A1G4IXZ3_9SACH|nr:LADA_0C01090g1_1 [Lachancea dasiensis]